MVVTMLWVCPNWIILRRHELVDFSLISGTYDKIHQHLVETPLLESPFLSDRLNKRVFIKAECLQKTGSFKYRGSWSSFVNNDIEDLKKGVLAYS